LSRTEDRRLGKLEKLVDLNCEVPKVIRRKIWLASMVLGVNMKALVSVACFRFLESLSPEDRQKMEKLDETIGGG